MIDHAHFGVAGLAILGVDLAVAQPDGDVLKRQFLEVSIKPDRVLSENFIRSGIGLLRSNRRIITSDVFCPLGFRQLRR